jgi:cobyric acid synthase
MMFPLVVAGCISDAVKALLVPTLRVWIRRNGVGGASFKTQNMSNNDSVVATDHGSGQISVVQCP